MERVSELDDPVITAPLKQYATMPPSTMIISNPPLYSEQVLTDGGEVELQIRGFAIRGLVPEHEIVDGTVGPTRLIFVGLFGRQPAGDEERELGQFLDATFFDALMADDHALVDAVTDFVTEYPGRGPEVAVQYFAALLKARGLDGGPVDNRRSPADLLEAMIRVHMRHMAIGGASIYANARLREQPGMSAGELADDLTSFLADARGSGRSALETCYGLLLGRRASEAEKVTLERMGAIQTHHGSAGSNMVARFMATLHTLSVSDLFVSSQMAMDSKRHFGAIHDMTDFARTLMALPEDERDDAVRQKVLTGGLPTFGHPMISAAGRSGHLQQDPRAAIYLAPVLAAIDEGALELSADQLERLALIQRIYQISLVEGVHKPGREDDPPLRLTPNTDFGAWSVQEALGIHDTARTYLTCVFRGFGWMMDVREQLQLRIMRPVVAPDPGIVPQSDGDRTIPDLVVGLHDRLRGPGHAFEPRA